MNNNTMLHHTVHSPTHIRLLPDHWSLVMRLIQAGGAECCRHPLCLCFYLCLYYNHT
jgi:hypothetical protein